MSCWSVCGHRAHDTYERCAYHRVELPTRGCGRPTEGALRQRAVPVLMGRRLGDSFGVASEADGPLIVVSLSNRTDALEGLEPPPPPKALCVGGVPQAEAAARYRQQERQAVREVLEDPSFRQAAERCAAELSEAGGVKEAARVIVKVASSA